MGLSHPIRSPGGEIDNLLLSLDTPKFARKIKRPKDTNVGRDKNITNYFYIQKYFFFIQHQ